jgi:hypothetical protein
MLNATAKRLRKLVRQLGLPEQTAYTAGGKLRRQTSFKHPKTGELLGGAPIPRPGVMGLCFRRAYKEAKKIYTGKPLSTLAPDTEDKATSFRARLADSMRAYHGIKD